MEKLDKKGVSLELIAAAAAPAGIIGVGDKIPWHSSLDFKYFKEQTMGLALLMGSNTARTFKKPLKDRVSLVLTSKRGNFEAPFIEVDSIQAAIDWCVLNGHGRLMVIGGGQVYDQTIMDADVILLNKVMKSLPLVDENVYFPIGVLMCRMYSEHPDYQVKLHCESIDRIVDIDKTTGEELNIGVLRYTTFKPTVVE